MRPTRHDPCHIYFLLTLEENYLLQLVLCNYACRMKLKNVTCNCFLVAFDMCSCIKQVTKDSFSISDIKN